MDPPNNSEVVVSHDLNSIEEINQPQYGESSQQIAEIKDEEQYTGDGKITQQGWIFQLYLLMLFLWRATHNSSIEKFRLASEYGPAKSLDDLVFQYKKVGEPGCKLRLLQAKHREDDIISSEKLKKPDGNFSLSKYFHSFLKVKRLCSLNSYYTMLSDTGEIEDILLVTTANTTDDVERNHLEKDSNAVFKDDMLEVDQKTFKNTACFKIKPNSNLTAVYEITSDLYLLVDYIADRVLGNPTSSNAKINTRLLKVSKDYHYPLMKYVFEFSDNKCIKFRDSFLNDTQTNQHCINSFRNMLIDKLAKKDISQEEVSIKHREKAIEKMREFSDEMFNGMKCSGRKFRKKLIPSGNLFEIKTFVEELSKLILKQPKKLTIDKTVSKIVKKNVPGCVGYVFVKCYNKVRFNTFFLDDQQSKNLPDDLKTFRNRLKNELNQNFEKLYECEVEMITFQQLNIPEENLFNINLPVEFSSDDVNEFEQKFKLIVNYPDRKHLIEVLNKCTGKDLFRTNTELFNAVFYHKMHHWLADTAGVFYTKAKAEELFFSLENEIKIWSVEFTNRQFFMLDKAEGLKVQFQSYNIVCDFLESTDKVLHIECSDSMCCRIRLGQTIDILQKKSQSNKHLQQYVMNDKYICIEKENNIIEPTFFNLIIIDCSTVPIEFIESEVSKVTYSTEKKIILLCEENDNDFLCLKDDSKKYVLNEKLIKLGSTSNTYSLSDVFGVNMIDKIPKMVLYHVFHKYLEKKTILIQNYTFCDQNKIKPTLNRLYFTSQDENNKVNEQVLLNRNEESLIVISGVAGIGKSTTLLKLFQLIKDLTNFVFLINLTDCCDVLKNLGINRDTGWSIHFLLKKLCKKLTDFEKAVLLEMFCTKKLDLFVLIDGFDDICPNYSNTVIEFVKDLNNTAKKIIISARISVLNYLLKTNQKSLSPIIYHIIAPLSKGCQEQYLENIWSDLNLTEEKKSLARGTASLDRSFYSIPLHLSMLVKCLESDTTLPENFTQNDLFKLFVQSCIDRYYKKIDLTGSEIEEDIKDYKILAMNQFRPFSKSFLKNFKLSRFEELQNQFQNGTAKKQEIVECIDKKPVFLHQRFVEYFVALWFVDTFKELNKNTTGRIKTKLYWLNWQLLKILTLPEHDGIRIFLYSYLDKVFTGEPWQKLMELAKFYDEKPEFTGKNLIQQIVWDNQTYSTDEEKLEQLKTVTNTFDICSVRFPKRLINKACLVKASERNLTTTKEFLRDKGSRILRKF